MSYTKTNWVNNTTPIDENNLNKIEKGIYDNSLVVDAVTNKLNPTDTETYKTAELTEGQITDVIGVNDIIIKGQTEQDGTPTPSAPVDVNVVSGSNEINTSNKNLLNINNAIAFRACTIQLQNNSIKIITDGTNNAIVRIPCVLTAGNYYLHFEGNTNIINVAFYNSNEEKIIANNPSSSKAITLSDNLAYININLSNVAGTYTLAFNKLYINLGSTDLSYEPHQGKELPLDLPVENLFDKNNITDSQFINADGTLSSSANYVTTDFIPIIPNSQYYLPKTSTRRLKYFNSNKQVLSSSDWDISSGNTAQVLTIPDNAYYVRFSIDKTQNDINTFQFEPGSKANAYTPYGTEPIELCKIGDYQDYFYKSGSKWYLHKEINKITSYNGETITTSYISTTGKLSTGAKVYYVVNSTNIEITDTTLISQLEAIYNAPLYEQTNITQTNNDLPMILDITACKDNINGIKAFIRK